MTALATRVFDCPGCGAPLPPSIDGAHVTCASCGQPTVIEDGGAAMLREQASRREAEALFATLGSPPSWSQRVAVALVNKWLWILGLPFMVTLAIRLGGIPEHAIARWWEHHRHVRLLHVLSPVAGWLFSMGWVAGLVIALLIWSLFGERIDARRDLQAALASRPPTTVGGAALCRHCNAPLEVAPGTVGARCLHCGADNLLQIPARWVARARQIDAQLRLSSSLAAARGSEGRRRMRRAALWRVPLVLALLAVVTVPAYRRHGLAGWRDFRAISGDTVWLYKLVQHQDTGLEHELHVLTSCADPRARAAVRADSLLATEHGTWCEQGVCTAVAMFALTRGDRLRLDWHTPGPARARIALAPIDYLGGLGVLWDDFGDQLWAGALTAGSAGATAVEVLIDITGWYKLDLRGPTGVVVEPCLVPATER